MTRWLHVHERRWKSLSMVPPLLSTPAHKAKFLDAQRRGMSNVDLEALPRGDTMRHRQL